MIDESPRRPAASTRRQQLGDLPRGKALELSYDDWRHTVSVDLDGAFLCAQRAARRMVEQGRGGSIVNVTSVHEFEPITDGVAYVVASTGSPSTPSRRRGGDADDRGGGRGSA